MNGGKGVALFIENGAERIERGAVNWIGSGKLPILIRFEIQHTNITKKTRPKYSKRIRLGRKETKKKSRKPRGITMLKIGLQ